ncbi:hypothetical protein RHMOL_Rhmol09G0046500 [Rhododendron molle]|uniref:Uncharacterized protein n=1 Tax=Rhododendron molle TaxID=49168 RepID=A0ACC0MB37_RHOML|nr:hypothetical protein RHMOL_Rhmol09G0046500 [Rhododendron molle]
MHGFHRVVLLFSQYVFDKNFRLLFMLYHQDLRTLFSAHRQSREEDRWISKASWVLFSRQWEEVRFFRVCFSRISAFPVEGMDAFRCVPLEYLQLIRPRLGVVVSPSDRWVKPSCSH